ncbi:MAG: putative toxin-antitoxin system toxin component, PIN family, partial [Chloroflexi bacterium RBG_16_54_11]
MRIVLDTNVLISGIFFTGQPYRILRAWQDGKIGLVVSSDIFFEYIRVVDLLAEQYPNINITLVLDLVMRDADVFMAKPLPVSVSEDPDDDKFIACALASCVIRS